MTTPPAALPRVHLIATGGTIAATGTGAGYRAGVLPLADLLSAVPELARRARITGEQLCNLGSQDLGPAQWLALARRLRELAGEPGLAGVVVTHGTDTMEETAYFLDQVLDGTMPVVLTGAMRPATAAGADGPGNLRDAVAVAVDEESRGRGVLVAFAGRIHAAGAVEKVSTMALKAFSSSGAVDLGRIAAGTVSFFSAPAAAKGKHGDAAALALPDALPRVDIIHAYAGMGGDAIDHAVAAGARGLVLAGVGAGNAAAAALAALAAATRAGVAVVRSSRVASGGVARGIEVDDDARGFIAARRLNPQQARILLMLALAVGEDVAQIQTRFSRE